MQHRAALPSGWQNEARQIRQCRDQLIDAFFQTANMTLVETCFLKLVARRVVPWRGNEGSDIHQLTHDCLENGLQPVASGC
jgi:hypothetical protein